MAHHCILLDGYEHIEIKPSRTRREGDEDWRVVPSTFQLQYRWTEDAPWQHHSMVYIVPEAQALIQAGKATGIELYTLWMNCPAQRALRAAPVAVVLSVRLADGSTQLCAPPEFKQVKRSLLAWAAFWLAAGAGLTLWKPVLGGILMGLATHKWRSAREVPRSQMDYPKVMHALLDRLEAATDAAVERRAQKMALKTAATATDSVAESLRRMEAPAFQAVARALEETVPADAGFGRFRGETTGPTPQDENRPR